MGSVFTLNWMVLLLEHDAEISVTIEVIVV